MAFPTVQILLVLLVLIVAAQAVSLSSVSFSTSILTKTVNFVAPWLNANVPLVHFSKVIAGGSGGCGYITGVAGNWISSLDIPANALSIELTSANTFSATFGQVVVSSDQAFPWAYHSHDCVWFICACNRISGSGSFQVSAIITANVAFDFAPDQPTTVSASGSNLNVTGVLELSGISADFGFFQVTLPSWLTIGVGGSGSLNINAAVADAMSTIFAALQIASFCDAQQNVVSQAVTLFTTDAAGQCNSNVLPSIAIFPGLPQPAYDVAIVVHMDVQPLNGVAGINGCFQFSACTNPSVVGPPISQTAQLTNCFVCLQWQNDNLYFGISAVLSLTSNDHSSTFKNKTGKRFHDRIAPVPRGATKRHRKIVAKARDAAERQRDEGTTTAPVAIEPSKFYLGTAFLQQVVSLSNPAVANILSTFSHPAVNDLPVPGAESYCTVSHGAITWPTIPPLKLKVSWPVLVSDGILVNVSWVGMTGLQATGTFVSSCSVPMPFGGSFVNTQTDSFTVALAFDNGMPLTATVLVQVIDWKMHTTIVGVSGFSIDFSSKALGTIFMSGYFDVYFTSTLTNHLHANMKSTLGQVAENWNGMVGATVKTFRQVGAVSVHGGTHITVTSRSAMANNLTFPSTLPATLASHQVAYVGNAGMPPPGGNATHSAQQLNIDVCSGALQLEAPASRLAHLHSCVTSSVITADPYVYLTVVAALGLE